MSGTERPQFYGITIWEGERGELYALGHHRPRLLLAAYSKYLRETVRANIDPATTREQRRALGDIDIESRWVRWNPDEKHAPWCAPGDRHAVAISVVRLP